MGLDCYVGSLTRYLTGDWELIAQKVGRELGMEVQVIRPPGAEEVERDPEVVRPVVEEWRRVLSDQLGEHLSSPLDWVENPEAPYFTGKPTWDWYAALQLWTAYEEQRHLERPKQVAEDWELDPAYEASFGADFRSRYMQILGVSLWLPCHFNFVFEAEDPAGVVLRMGSSFQLVEQLNGRTWQAGRDLITSWGQDCPEHGEDLERGAQFAFALMHRLGEQSTQHRLPMRLDW